MSSPSTKWLADLSVGATFQTTGRTITEADLVLFTGLIGLQEELFVNFAKRPRVLAEAARRIVPGVLVLAYAEGLVAQVGWLRGSGRAFMHACVDFRRPVFVGDTITCNGTVSSVTESDSGRHGRVEFEVAVSTEEQADVVGYTAARLVSASPSGADAREHSTREASA